MTDEEVEEELAELMKENKDYKMLIGLMHSVNMVEYIKKDMAAKRIKIGTCHIKDNLGSRERELENFNRTLETIADKIQKMQTSCETTIKASGTDSKKKESLKAFLADEFKTIEQGFNEQKLEHQHFPSAL